MLQRKPPSSRNSRLNMMRPEVQTELLPAPDTYLHPVSVSGHKEERTPQIKEDRRAILSENSDTEVG